MGDTMTQEETAKILTWAGIQRKRSFRTGRYFEWPALEGDFADVVAMKCLRKLPSLRLSRTPEISDQPWSAHLWGTVTLVYGVDPAQAIFAAVLAYLEEK